MFFISFPTRPLPGPARPAPARGVDIDTFVRELKGEPAPAPQQRGKAAGQDTTAAPNPTPADPGPRYRDEARRIVTCARDATVKAGGDTLVVNDDTVEAFRRDLERVADSRDRGAAYVADAARVVCTLLADERVVKAKQADRSMRLFIPAVNFHLKSWDAQHAEVRKFEAEESRRVRAAQAAEEARVADAGVRARIALLVAGGAFGLFMAIALYLIIAAIESNLRRIGSAIERIEARHTERADPVS